jgi:hypothetical protein
MKYVFLSPYSPDFNPIELAFSSIKAHLRRNGDPFQAASGSPPDKATILTLLHESVWSVTPDKAKAWFKHCGYM